MTDWLAASGLAHIDAYLTALAIGLLVGLERERNPTAKAGLRTCAFIALAGALSATLASSLAAPAIVAVGFGAVVLMMVAAYYPQRGEPYGRDPGTTTIAAVALCFLLGAMVVAGHLRLAVILSIVATMLLYFKAELGGAARNLERRDLVSMLQFAVVAFVVLPLLPDRGYGPYGALNPRHIGLMVVLISGLSLAGYVALRIVGRAHGALLLGLFGGLVSSTATTLAYARDARATDERLALAGTVIVTANLVVLVRLSVIGAVVAKAIVPMLVPVLAAGLVSGACAFALGRRQQARQTELAMPTVANPTELRAALGFALVYAVVLVLSAWLGDVWGRHGVYAIAIASGLVDVDAIALGNLRLFQLGQLSAAEAVTAIVVAFAANGVFKLTIVRVAGGNALLGRCLPSVVATVAGAAAGLAFLRS